jgi:endoglucanase
MEYGLSEAGGNGAINTMETTKWFLFVDQYSLSACNWLVIDKNETSAALVRCVDPNGYWKDSDLSVSGKIIRNRIRSLNGPLFEILKSASK